MNKEKIIAYYRARKRRSKTKQEKDYCDFVIQVLQKGIDLTRD